MIHIGKLWVLGGLLV